MACSSATPRIKLAKLADAIIGRWLVGGVRPCEPTPLPLSPNTMRRILVIRPGGIGDAVLLVPFLQRLKQVVPNATVDVLAERRNRQVFSAAGSCLDACYSYDQAGWSLWSALRRKTYDVIFDTEQWHHLSAFLAAILGAPVRVGFRTNPRRLRGYTVLVSYSHHMFEGDSFLRMLSVVTGTDVHVSWDQPFLQPSPQDVEWARRRLGQRALVALSVRGGIRERCWQEEKFLQLAGWLLKQSVDVCLLGTGSDGAFSERIARSLPQERLVNLTGQTPLGESLAVLSQCRLFIGTDSGLMHLAYAVGTPVVALFGAGIQEKWAPPSSRVRIVNRQLPCSPCTRFGYTPRCPIGVQCLREISVEAVAAACRELLQRVS